MINDPCSGCGQEIHPNIPCEEANLLRRKMYPNFKLPKIFLIGYTTVDYTELEKYLKYTDQLEFLQEIEAAIEEGLDEGEILCSFYAKMCYASLTNKKNKNITKTRAIADNLKGVIESGHGSVLEHINLNFVITDCSRVFTHELVRHRVGVAFSQTSGRYVRSDVLKVVMDPILSPAHDLVEEARVYLENWYNEIQSRMKMDEIKDFTTKKKITSALRRMLPNGQSNEIGVTLNIRSLRHTIEMRTSRHAEWEIRYIFNQIYDLMKNRFPIMFFDANEELIEGQNEITFKNKKV